MKSRSWVKRYFTGNIGGLLKIRKSLLKQKASSGPWPGGALRHCGRFCRSFAAENHVFSPGGAFSADKFF
ncbi:MAG: hypothetical protein A3B15_03210 [Candidatus Buchananbacteria bacterium RIFCSPLOWO2_01_FULL_45_31]|uniref:Uncharacterized protein n=1 Tax=Candidatus Buchananbacteria bacterium RIFCSPLOWO2_01_FULL_45_31 TaxID=1797545 RepID=A0A1G1YLS0_9BACT|nr:MAG: hypothetical protein A3B15_03210 [Candidatus Buchananbacteria bacterium RIFCSPLOWO2_01_FULL_45_31]